MAIPVEHVKATILAFIGQMKDAVCESKAAHGVSVDMPEELKISVTIIAPSGLNSLPRTTIQTQGERVETTEQPEKLVTETSDPVVSTTENGASTSVSTSQRAEPKQTVTRTSAPGNTTTTRSGTQDVSETTDSQTSSQQSARTAGGGNNVTRTNNYTSE